MNRFRKAISVGMSAALVASLLTFIAASTAFAGITVGSAGSVPRAGTSAGPATFTFTENSATALNGTTPGSFTVTIADSAAGATVHFTGTGAISAPGSLGASLTVGDNFFTVDVAGNDPLNVETIVVSGLSIKADAGAALGAITATSTGGAVYNAFVGGTVTATGVIQFFVAAGGTSVIVDVTSACSFAVTAGLNGNAIFTNENKAITGVAASGTLQNLTVNPTTNSHAINETVTQTVANCSPTALASPGTVVDSAIYNTPTIQIVFPGETNQAAGNLSITERTAGFLSVGTTITFTIDTAGVTFSNAPSSWTNNGLVVSGGALGGGSKNVSYTVTTASSAPATLTVYNILYDVAASVPSGTSISVTASLSGGKVIVPTSRVNAIVNRIFNASASPIPNVYIGENSQATGLISLTEVNAGSFTDGTGSFNTFLSCLASGWETFTSPGPWARVVGGTAAGNLRLREGTIASPDNIVQGAPLFYEGGTCYYWTVWSASTTASTIQIGNADFTSGPLINVVPNAVPGPVNAGLWVGSVATLTFSGEVLVTIANRVFRNQVVVTALSQPVIPQGATDALAGNIQIAETGAGQLKNGEFVCVELLPRSSNFFVRDTYLKALNTSDTPVVTATGGVVVSNVFLRFQGCSLASYPIPPTFTNAIGFYFFINQQSTSGQGKLVISNIHYTTTADAPLGPVLLNVFGFPPSSSTAASPPVGGTNMLFQSTISNARIGSQLAGTAATRLGVTQTGAFTTSTKVAKTGKYVTYRFDFGVGAAGQTFKVWGATKTGNDWSAFSVATSRVANASGVVYYYIRQNSAAWKSYRAQWTGGGVFTPARQARWIP